MSGKSIVRWGAVASLVLAAAVLAAGVADARTSAKKPGPLAALIKQSRGESGIVVYGNPPAANFNALVDRFHYYYPWIKVTEYDLDDNTIFSKYASEAAQGVRTADLLIASAPNLWVYAARKGYVQNFTPQDLDKYPSFVKQYPGVYVMSPDPAIIVYNKLLLKDKVPTSVAAIASDAATYGKLTGYTVDNTFGYTGLYGYVQKKGWSNLQTIAKRLKPTTGVGSQLQLVAQGGAVAAYLTSPTARFTIKNNSQFAQILDWTYATDATPIVTRGIGVTKKAASPASAKLFLDFVYSKAGQLAMCDAGFTAFRNDYVPSDGCTNTLADVYKKVGQKNVFVAGFTQKFVNDRPAFAKRWHGIFG
ncbi:MAG: extracellular solute-binding protein [Thermoleophilia bacterium]|nr:extracellular solute-binding protein [Thermoleophilia bacterium]